MHDVTIAPMQAGHSSVVLAIYAEGIATGNATFETNVPAWEDWDTGHLEACRFVALVDDRVAGWAALSPVSKRRVYAGVAEVSVYVATHARGHGVGLRLLQTLVECSERTGIWTLQASVFPENAATLRLHTRLGFRVVGRRERIARHNGTWRDTLLLERRSERVGLGA